MQRRTLLQSALVAPPAAALGLAGLLPARTMAKAGPPVDTWPDRAFHAEALDEAVAELFEGRDAEETDRITLTAPDIAENGRVVPVEVAADLPDLQTVTLLSDGNPFPLLARARFTPAVAPRVSIRVKMGQSANLIALVEADGKLYRTTRAVKVTAGGCGG
jgi:sulfur-oxidizing protein SoxY